MLIRAIVLFLIFCTGCKSGIIPCPEVKGLRLKKSQVNKRFRFDRDIARQQPEPVITVSSDAETPQPVRNNPRKIKYVQYKMQHINVEEMDCPRPGEKKSMSRSVREKIRKNRKKVRYYYEEPRPDTVALAPVHYPQR